MRELVKWRHPEPDDIVDRLSKIDQAIWFAPDVAISRIKPFYTLDQLIAWANEDLEEKGCERWHQDARYPVTQFVKICRLYQDFKLNRKNIKPFLLTPRADGFEPLTGDSRLRAYELIPGAHCVAAVITGSLHDADGPIREMTQLATMLELDAGTVFYLRIDEGTLPALEWYEIDIATPIPVTGPGFVEQAQRHICEYVQKQGPNFRFDRDWFRQPHPWSI